MPSKGTPSASDPDAAAASLRKRKQNRISQQCLREKKSAASSGFFEKLNADIRALREGCERSGQVDAAELLAINEGLVEENRNLREALLRMRKKLLSLSSAADSAADDPIFQKMLAKEPDAAANRRNGTSAGPAKRRKYSTSPNETSGSSDPPDELPYIRDGSSSGDAILDTAGDPSGSLNPSTTCQQLTPTLVADGQPDLSFLSQDMPGMESCADVQSALSSSNELSSGLAFPLESMAQHSLAHTALLDAWMNRSYANFVAQKIENACIRYAVHSRVCESDSPASGAALGRGIGREMVGRLAEIATHMIFDDNGLGKWIDTLEGAREFLKSVLTYRILLGCAKPPDVLDDFEADCPPWSTGTKPIIVDLIAWPSLRDQMMFHSSFYDLDEMAEDVINYTVVDIPEHRIALQLYRSPPNRFPTVPRPEESTYQNPFKFSQRENTIKIAQLQNQELYDIIARRMDSPVGEDGVASTCRGIPGSPQAECLLNNAEPVKRVKDWKLSGAFFKKYPFLQCSSLASRYPFCLSSKLPRA